MTQSNQTTVSAGERLVWSSRLVMNGLAGEGIERREKEIESARARRPHTAHIEREIIWAVVVLYSAIIASFAALHLYGHFTQAGG